MKKIIDTILILFLLSNWTFAQEINCVRKAYFGKTEICLPQIEGYQECYSDSIVKQVADGTEVPVNMVLGFYLNNETFEKKDSLGLFSFDNYFKVYGTKQIKDYKANYELLKQMQDVLAGNFISKNWELMLKEIDKIGLELEIGVPTVIKTYNLNKNSFTYVMLARYEIEGVEPYTMAMTINGLLINERLIWMAYYLNYNGDKTILELQEKSNTILTKLLRTEK
tara:strand:- start:1042 stop:1713 length:672 start_codon:yes stop_codon:yes gene_type:complete